MLFFFCLFHLLTLLHIFIFLLLTLIFLFYLFLQHLYLLIIEINFHQLFSGSYTICIPRFVYCSSHLRFAFVFLIILPKRIFLMHHAIAHFICFYDPHLFIFIFIIDFLSFSILNLNRFHSNIFHISLFPVFISENHVL